MKKILLLTTFFASIFCNVIAQPNFNHLAQITGSARINSTKVDKNGNIYYSGFYSAGSDFNLGVGTYTVAAKGASDPFIAKYDSNYNLIWVKSIGGTSGYDYGYHIAIDDSGFVYGIGAISEGACDLDPGPAILSHTVASVSGGRGMDIYIIKLDSVGTMKWVETFPSYNYDMDPEWYIDIDNAGNIVTSLYIRAGTTIDLNFGIGAPQPQTFSTNTFALLKQSKYQQSIWLRQGAYATHFDFDENNNIYAVGDKMNIYKLSSSGTYVWGYILGSATSFNVINTSGDYASAICYDKKGHIYITGSTYNSAIDYNPGSGVQTLSHNNSSREIYVLKWDTTANFKWVKKFDAVSGCGTQYYNYAEDIKTDNRGNVYTCGGINYCDFDPSSTNTYALGLSCSGSDLFISKLDSSGNYVWAKSIGSVNGTDYLKSIAITQAENVIFGGFFSYQIDIDPGPGVTYIGTATSLQNALVGGVGCNKFSEKKDSTCVLPYVLNGYNYMQSGRYIQSIAASGASCDSLIYLDLKTTNPDISVSSNTAICIGNTTSLTVNSTSSGVSYEWSTGDNITNIVVSPTVTTIYTATVTSITDSNCKSTKTISVTVNNLPTVTANSTASIICNGSSVILTGGGASTYSWSNGVINGASFNPTTTNTYTVSGIDANGCVNSATKTITVNAMPIITVNSGTICNGQSFTITPSGASTYTFSSGTAIVSPTTNTTYTVTGTNTQGCVNSIGSISSVTVDIPIILATTNNTLLCIGQTASLSVTGATTYTWSTTENNSTITVSPTVQTTYTVDGTSANGCVNTTTVIQDVSLCTGINSLNNNETEINVYPNPFNGKILIITNGSKQNVQIFNALGYMIYNISIIEEKTEIDLSHQPAGIYFIKIGAVTKKLIKE